MYERNTDLYFQYEYVVCRHTAIVTLWGANVKEFDANDLIKRDERERVILLIMGCTFKMQIVHISCHVVHGLSCSFKKHVL